MGRVKRLLKKVKHLSFDDRLTVLYENFGDELTGDELERLALRGA